MDEGTLIDGEVVGPRQLADLNRARAFLCDIAARNQDNCDVFDSVERVCSGLLVSAHRVLPGDQPHHLLVRLRVNQFRCV